MKFVKIVFAALAGCALVVASAVPSSGAPSVIKYVSSECQDLGDAYSYCFAIRGVEVQQTVNGTLNVTWRLRYEASYYYDGELLYTYVQPLNLLHARMDADTFDTQTWVKVAAAVGVPSDLPRCQTTFVFVYSAGDTRVDVINTTCE